MFLEWSFTSFYMQPITLTRSLSKDVASGLKSAAVGGKGGGGGSLLNNCGLVKFCLAVVALRWIAAVLRQLARPHLALALPQLGHVALEAQAEFRLLSPPGGRLQRPLLQMHPLHVHHLLNRQRATGPFARWFCVGGCDCSKERKRHSEIKHRWLWRKVSMWNIANNQTRKHAS